jgi:hypothetical protein
LTTSVSPQLLTLPQRKRSASEEFEIEPPKRLRVDQDIAVRIAKGKEPPSTAAQPSHLTTQQAKDPLLIGRPYDARGPPVILYVPAFAKFYSRMRAGDSTPTAPSDFYSQVGQLLVASSDIYRKEEMRESVFLPALEALLDRNVETEYSDDPRGSDRVCKIRLPEGQSALILLYKLKNEIGTGRCDPSVHASFSFSRWWSQGKVS